MTDAPADDIADDTAAAPRPRRRLRRFFVGAALVMLIALAVYAFVMYRAVGTYIADPYNLDMIEVGLTPRPVWAIMQLGTAPGSYLHGSVAADTRWWIGRDGIHLRSTSPSTLPGRTFPTDRTSSLFIEADSPGTLAATIVESSASVTIWRPTERLPNRAADRMLRWQYAHGWDRMLPDVLLLVSEAPDAVLPVYWSVAILSRLGRYDEARDRLARARERFLRHSGDLGKLLYLSALEESAGGPVREMFSVEEVSGHPGLHSLTHHPADMIANPDQVIAKFFAHLERQSRRLPAPPIYFLYLYALPGAKRWDDEIEWTLMARLMRGERDGATDLAFGWHNARHLAYGPKWPRSVAFAEPTAALFQLIGDLYLDGNPTVAETEELWRRLEYALSTRHQDRLDALNRIESPKRALPPGAGREQPHRYSTYADRMIELRLHALREAVRIRHHHLALGRWPDLDENGHAIGLLLPCKEPTLDPFTDPPVPLRVFVGDEEVVVFSVGPNGVNDTALGRDPSMPGGIAAADIPGRAIPRAPRHEFPEHAGHRYADVAELRRRYPSGLPTPFGMATDAEPLAWAPGPDGETDASGGRNPLPGRAYEVEYDPTNGLESNGDVWIRLPMAWPLYDPTNGTYSGNGVYRIGPMPPAPPEPAPPSDAASEASSVAAPSASSTDTPPIVRDDPPPDP